MVSMKTEDEIKKLKRSGRVVALVFEAVADIIKPGVSTYEIDQVAERVIRKEGAIPSFLNYGQPPFPASTCISINDEVVHGIPRKDRIVQDGDIVSLDVGAVLDGYHGDAARTYIIGDVPKETSDLVRVTEECFWKAFEVTVTGNGSVMFLMLSRSTQNRSDMALFVSSRVMVSEGIFMRNPMCRITARKVMDFVSLQVLLFVLNR